LYGSLAIHSKKKWHVIVCAIVILGVAMSRMYFGYHTPKDVLTSMGISLFIVYLIIKVFTVNTYKPSSVALFLGVFSAIVLIYIIVLKNLPNADLTQFNDCFKAAGAGLAFALGWYIEPTYINFDEKKGSLLVQFTKLFLGLLTVLVLKFGLKVILGTSLTANAIRYFIIVCFIMILYPMVIVKFNKK
jgi:undecaprenyl-diphosphatase